MDIATLAGGCFWCLEAVFLRVKGVTKVVSGYMGGHEDNPNYRQVCAGTTGHAEVVQLTFDPLVVTYRDLLEIFFAVHDPTTLNRQGNDIGTQYRSAIFFHSAAQEMTARQVILEKERDFADPIVTVMEPVQPFYEAESYHQDYFARNPNQPYCVFVVGPKVKKFLASHADMLRV